MTPNALFVGLCTVDIAYLLDSYPPANAKVTAERYGIFAGGPAANAAIAFSQMGDRSALATALGRHRLAEVIREEMGRYGVALTDVSPDGTGFPPLSSILSSRTTGDRNVIAVKTDEAEIDVSILTPETVQSVNIVLVDGHYMPLCLRAAQLARDAGIPVVLDGGSWKEGTETLIEKVDIAICSENFRPPGTSDPTSALTYLRERGVAQAAVSRGNRSIRFFDYESEGEVDIPEVDAIDTLGAGDVLHGAFCYYYAESRDFRESLRCAAEIATESCRYFGTREWAGKR